jgi:hypothetical protein
MLQSRRTNRRIHFEGFYGPQEDEDERENERIWTASGQPVAE